LLFFAVEKFVAGSQLDTVSRYSGFACYRLHETQNAAELKKLTLRYLKSTRRYIHVYKVCC